MQEQLNKQYIDFNLNPIVEPMIFSYCNGNNEGQDPVSEMNLLILNQIDFMIAYLKENFGNRLSLNEGERAELEFLRDQVPKLRKEVGTKDEEASSSDSGSDGDDVADLAPPMIGQAAKRGPRMSVSAEVFGKFNR